MATRGGQRRHRQCGIGVTAPWRHDKINGRRRGWRRRRHRKRQSAARLGAARSVAIVSNSIGAPLAKNIAGVTGMVAARINQRAAHEKRQLAAIRRRRQRSA
jgi:hypothetical protein